MPLLVGKVNEYEPIEDSSSQALGRERHDALLAVLDALIDMGATIPAKEARKLYPEFSAQSIILLVRSPDDTQSALFEIFRQAKANWTWLAAGNALLENRAPGFAAQVLNRFTQHLTVSVVDTGIGGGSGGGGSECDFSHRGPKAGWPPVGLYQLTQFPERFPHLASTFLVRGETSVYYWRVEPGNYDNPPDEPGACDDGNRDVYRAQYANKLLADSFPRINLDPYPHITVEWHGESDYRQELSAVVEQQRKLFTRAVAYLRESGRALTPTEAALLNPRLEIAIQDERADRAEPLPAILGNNGGVAVAATFTRPLY